MVSFCFQGFQVPRQACNRRIKILCLIPLTNLNVCNLLDKTDFVLTTKGGVVTSTLR